jgi:hypothetical protein
MVSRPEPITPANHPVNRLLLSAAAAGALAASGARAGETACWFENGVVVVPAQVMGVGGDYILDTATPHTQLADTQAQAAGYVDTALNGEVWLAGERMSNRPVAVAGLDMRTGALPTPIAGVIGADVLAAYVVDVRFGPCRVTLAAAGKAAAFGPAQALPLTWIAGRPTAPVAVSDGPHAFSGDFAVGVGVDTMVRLSDGLAAAPGAAKPKELYPYGVARPRLRALSFAGRLWEQAPAGLVAAEAPALAGVIGAPLLSAYRLRFDFPAGRLLLAAP